MKNVIFKLIVPLLGIIAMLGFITLYNPIQKQNAALVGNIGNLSCGGAGSINLSFSDSCPSGVAALSSYQPSVTFALNNSNRSNYYIDWAWKGFFCTSGNPAKCLPNNAMSSTDSHGDHISLAHNVTGSTAMPSKGQFGSQVCGAWQYDMEFAVYHYNGSSRVYDCTYGVQDPINSPGSALYCHTNVTCTVPPTATPTLPAATNTPVPPTATPTQPVQNPTATPTQPVENPTATPTQPVENPTATPTGVNTNSCDNTTQTGTGNNNNCNQNNNNNSSSSDSSSSSSSESNNTINITLNGGGQQQQQQQVLAAATTAPTELPKTGAEGPILFGLLTLIPVGWKLRKLV